MRIFGRRDSIGNKKVEGKLADWRSAKSHLSFAGCRGGSRDKERASGDSGTDVPCPQLEEKKKNYSRKMRKKK